MAQQIYNRALERLNTLSISENKPLSIELQNMCKLNGETIFKRFKFNGIQLNPPEKNKWFITKNKQICSFIYAKYIDEKPKIVCNTLNGNFEKKFDDPMNSIELNICWIKIHNNNTTDLIIDAESIEFKMFLVPFSDGSVFVPIINM